MPESQQRLWLIGGTHESVRLAEAIASLNLPCLVTVTTAAAESLYPQTPSLQVQVGRLNRTQIQQLCQQHHIIAILDASHPYAVEISRLAIATAQCYQIPYLRFERPVVKGCRDAPWRVSTVRAGFEETLSSTA
ncbi:MAG: precorrin-6A/cobalt-precorrin-6A reductase, partial [Coleofasciculus sp. C2-GNP5-27]